MCECEGGDVGVREVMCCGSEGGGVCVGVWHAGSDVCGSAACRK